ncbi:MAG: CotH kinase family protein [Caldilineaceae bacterium]
MRIGARNANLLFWLLLALILIFNLPRLLLTPTMSTGSDTSPVIITEFLARNQNGLVDDEGDHVDWIELYNRSAQAVNLEGWSLTDNPALPDKWRFPSLNLAPNGYLVVFASGKDVVRPQDSAQSVPAQPLILHTNFRLSGNGGFLALYAPTSRRYLETVPINYGPQRADVTYGRLATTRDAAQAAYLFFTEPTPGAPNSTTTAQLPQTAPVAFSRPHGLYNKMIDVALSTPTSGAAIWYTTDGSMPTPDHGERYVAPLTIATTTILRATAIMTDQLPSAVATQSYIFPIAVLLQPADPPGMPTTWGTHPISFGGGVAGQPVQADYAMDPRVTEDPVQQRQLLAGLQSLPSLSLVLPTADFAALYSDPQARGGEAEYAVSVELLPAGMTAVDADAPAAGAANPPANSGTNAAAVPAEDTFQIDAGIRIQGGAGRWEYMPKHSFRLFFKGIYGATKLPYRLFPNSPVNAFDTLVLRAGVDRSFAGHPDTPDLRQTTYTRDEWLRATQIAMSGVGSHGRFAHLYINGLYWGLYNVVERPDASFAAAYYGGNKDEWAAVNHGGSVSGPIDRFATLIRLAQEGGLADPTRYATMLEFIDPVQFSDYLIANWYAGNVDWPENNWYADVQYPAGRNLFFMWDGERTWDSGAVINLGSTGVEGAAFPNVIRLVFEALMENADFRLLFADRLYTHLAADGALSEGIVQERWRAITEPLAAAIVAESARWGDVRTETPITQEECAPVQRCWPR